MSSCHISWNFSGFRTQDEHNASISIKTYQPPALRGSCPVDKCHNYGLPILADKVTKKLLMHKGFSVKNFLDKVSRGLSGYPFAGSQSLHQTFVARWWQVIIKRSAKKVEELAETLGNWQILCNFAGNIKIFMMHKKESLLDNIPQASHMYLYLGCWANGREGSITDSNGHGVYRFYPMTRKG